MRKLQRRWCEEMRMIVGRGERREGHKLRIGGKSGGTWYKLGGRRSCGYCGVWCSFFHQKLIINAFQVWFSSLTNDVRGFYKITWAIRISYNLTHLRTKPLWLFGLKLTCVNSVPWITVSRNKVTQTVFVCLNQHFISDDDEWGFKDYVTMWHFSTGRRWMVLKAKARNKGMNKP